MIATCAWHAAGVLNLVLAPFVIGAAALSAWLARRARLLGEQATQATRNAALLTSRVVAYTAPWLECQVCGDTLDPRVGVAVGLTADGQLRVRCHDHEEGQ